MATAAAAPGWWAAIRNTFVSSEAHAYLLSGDLAGYVERTRTVRGYLGAALAGLVPRASADQPRIVATYNRATGIAFQDEAARQRAIALVTGDAPARPPAPRAGGVDIAAILGNAPGALPADPFDATEPLAALRQLDALLRAGSNQVAVVIDEAATIAPPAELAMLGPADRTVLVLLKLWGRDPKIIASGNLILLLAADVADLHPDLRGAASGWRAVEVPLPDEPARRAFIDYYTTSRGVALADGLSPEALGRLTAGLNLRHIEDILLAGAERGGVTAALVKQRKDEVIRTEFSEVAEMLDPLPGGLGALGGLAHVKAWVEAEVIAPMTQGRIQDVPKGILLVGPPGTGKTYLARALAGAVNMNCVSLQAAKIQSSLVGASERALARFFRFARSLAPTIVFVDEIDQSDLGSRGNASGNPVAKNLFGALLQFLGDESIRGRVIVLFASNRPDLLDEALLRFGRMDAIVPVLLPEAADRAAIAQVHLAARGATADAVALAALADGTDRYSAADVAAVVTKAVKLARAAGRRDAVSADDIRAALRVMRPRTPQIADRFTRLAIEACNDLSLLPPPVLAWFEAQAGRPDAAPAGDDDAVAARGRRW
jgi:ATP-dependent 26S proteasome regulatory subunit